MYDNDTLKKPQVKDEETRDIMARVKSDLTYGSEWALDSINEKAIRELISVDHGGITLNSKTLEAELKGFLEYVQGLTVNEAQLPKAKKAVAWIRKQIVAMDSQRKEAKKRYMEPYELFHFEMIRLNDYLMDAVTHLNDQINELEDKLTDQKYQDIEELFAKRKDFYGFTHITLGDFMKTSYLNKSVSLNKIEEDMAEWFDKISLDLASIEVLDKPGLKEKYFELKDLNRALQEIIREEKAKEAEYAKEREQNNLHVSQSRNEPQAKLHVSPYRVTLVFLCENDALEALGHMKRSGIKYVVEH